MNRIEKRGNVSIIDNSYLLKEEEDLTSLFQYLQSRDFSYFPSLIERNEQQNRYEYVKDYQLPKEQLGQDIANTLALLHNKTSYSKEVNIDAYKDIYEHMLGYANYIEEQYGGILKKIEYIDFPAPSELLFITNFSKLKEAIYFVKSEIEKWYSLVKDTHKTRVCMNHGNMKLEHAINSDKTYFISWRYHHFDSPVVDLINFYQNEWEHLEFSSILEKYFAKCTWTEEEKKLFFINISLPHLVAFDKDEMINVMRIRKLFDYVYKTEKLIGPYYTIKNEE